MIVYYQVCHILIRQLRMNKLKNIQELINHTKKLMDNNQELVKANNNYFELIEQLHERQEKILIYSGKFFKFLNSKNEKT